MDSEYIFIVVVQGFCRKAISLFNVILQNRAQLQALFKDSWQVIIGNTDVLIYLGGNEAETHKYMTEMLGKYTVGKNPKEKAPAEADLPAAITT